MDKAVIYLRVSTQQQDEELQKKDCLDYCQNHNFEVIGIYQERVSAFKEDINRPERDKVIEIAHLGQANHIVVWAFDRWIRRRDTLMEDVNTLLNLGCKLHSIKDSWFESINIDGPLGKTIKEFMLGIIGSLAEMESQRKSERIWLGKQHTKIKQGRKEKLTDKEKEEIKIIYAELKSLHKTAAEYGRRHKPKVSYGTIYNVVKPQ